MIGLSILNVHVRRTAKNLRIHKVLAAVGPTIIINLDNIAQVATSLDLKKNFL